MFKKQLAFTNPGTALIMPVLGGCVVSWLVTSHQAKQCQNMWMALEGKHSDINPIAGTLFDGY